MNPNIQIRGYYPGVIGTITALHATYYHDNWGFDISFETQVARELSEFLLRFDNDRDVFLTAVSESRFVGAVAVDGMNAAGEGARVRWFIVDPAFQGSGAGRILFQHALDRARKQGHSRFYLWTFKGLEAARKLFEDAGFKPAVEEPVDQWGTTIFEQKYELTL